MLETKKMLKIYYYAENPSMDGSMSEAPMSQMKLLPMSKAEKTQTTKKDKHFIITQGDGLYIHESMLT